MSATLPANRALLAGVHIFCGARSEEKGLHVFRQEIPRLRVHDVQAVMIDQHRLLTNPLLPAVLTDLGRNTRPDRPGKWCAFEPRPRLPAADTLYISHGGKWETGKSFYERAYSTFANRIAASRRMYSHPMSNSYHLALNLADFGSAWWLLCSSSPPSQIAIGVMFRLSSFTSKFRY